MIKRISALPLAMVLFASPALADEESAAVASPNCDAERIKELGGDGVVKVEKGEWEGGFNVTLETSKLTFAELIEKMAEADCM